MANGIRGLRFGALKDRLTDREGEEVGRERAEEIGQISSTAGAEGEDLLKKKWLSGQVAECQSE